MAITYLGSAIWSYNRFKTGAILLTIVPAMIITSACLGVALATSKPNREKSYFEEATLIISIPQQLVAKVRGQRELERAQFMMSWIVEAIIPPPGVSYTCPGKSLFASRISFLTSISTLLFYVRTKTRGIKRRGRKKFR